MTYVTLSNGVKMPMQGFGVFQVDDLSVCQQAVSDAIVEGYRLFDTAYTYNNEQAVGEAIRRSGLKREDFFVTTKAWISDFGYDQTLRAFDRSLAALGMEYVDLYLLHMPLADYYGSWRALERLYREKRVRAIGVSNFSAARLMDLCYNCEVRPMVNQIELHPHFQREEDLEVMRSLGIQPHGWAPFAEGMKGMFTEPTLQRIAEKHHKTVAQIVLRWNIERGVIVIPKSVHRERIRENFNIWDFQLDAEDMQHIALLETGKPSMLDCEKPSEIRRLYGYLENPTVTSL